MKLVLTLLTPENPLFTVDCHEVPSLKLTKKLLVIQFESTPEITEKVFCFMLSEAKSSLCELILVINFGKTWIKFWNIYKFQSWSNETEQNNSFKESHRHEILPKYSLATQLNWDKIWLLSVVSSPWNFNDAFGRSICHF